MLSSYLTRLVGSLALQADRVGWQKQTKTHQRTGWHKQEDWKPSGRNTFVRLSVCWTFRSELET